MNQSLESLTAVFKRFIDEKCGGGQWKYERFEEWERKVESKWRPAFPGERFLIGKVILSLIHAKSGLDEEFIRTAAEAIGTDPDREVEEYSERESEGRRYLSSHGLKHLLGGPREKPLYKIRSWCAFYVAALAVAVDLRGGKREIDGPGEISRVEHIVQAFEDENFPDGLTSRQRGGLREIFRRRPKELAMESLQRFFGDEAPSKKSLERHLRIHRTEIGLDSMSNVGNPFYDLGFEKTVEFALDLATQFAEK